MKPGIYAGIPNAEYHGGPGISKSGLDLINRSALHLKAAIDAREAAKESGVDSHTSTPAQAIGTAVHSIILEPAEFVKDYCLSLRAQDVPEAIEDRETLVAMVAKLNETRLPKLSTSGSKAELIARLMAEVATGDANVDAAYSEGFEAMKGAELKAQLDSMNATRTGLLSTSGSKSELAELLRANGVPVKLWADVLAEWMTNNGHRIVLSKADWDMVHAMRDAVMAHPAAYGVLTRGKNVVVDLKTTEDASEEGFAKSIANWRYDVQDPYYLDGLSEALRQSGHKPPEEGAAELSAYWIDQKTGTLCRCRPDFWRGLPKNFVFIAVEKKPPYAVGVYILDPESRESGRAQYRSNLEKYTACVANDNWPGYGEKIKTIRVPAWHLRKSEHLVSAS